MSVGTEAAEQTILLVVRPRSDHHPVLRAITLVQHGGLLLIIPGLLPSQSPGMTSSLIERSEVRTRSIVGLRRTNHSQQYRLTGSFVAHRYDRRTLADAY